ncbi:MAG: DNA methyltransferase [Gammaproteobacteria bacterium]
MKRNTLYYGDCLEVMREWPDACVDLIYLDPPFNSNADYNMLFGRRKGKNGPAALKRKDLAQMVAFTDTWKWDEETGARIAEIRKSMAYPIRDVIIALDTLFKGGNNMMAYLVYMADRVVEMHRVLKDTGSFYLHCDPSAAHYLKIMLDGVFDPRNFRDEIFWKRATSAQKGSQHAAKKWGSNVDCLFFYTKSDEFHLRQVREITAKEIKEKFDRTDEKGARYYDDSAHIWSGPGMGDRPHLCYEWRGFTNPHPSGWRLSKARLEEEFQKGNFVIDEDGKLQRRTYLQDYEGVPLGNMWTDIPPAGGKERLGYKTQKPIALLKRIVAASSLEGDVVVDPFCGCGTTVDAAMQLKRDFIGIDISMYALDVIQHVRLKNTKFIIEGTPFDFSAARDMAQKRPFAFEKWAIHRIAGFVSNNKQSGDGGVDGWAALLNPPLGGDGECEDGVCIAQVKGGAPNVNDIKAMLSQLRGGFASLGVFITLEKWNSRTAKKCIAEAGKFRQGAEQYNRLVVWSVEEYFDGVAPKLPARADPRTGKAFQSDIPSDD